MKKILTLLFVLLICFSLSITAFAAEEEGEKAESILDLAVEFVTDNSAQILSLMTFIGSLVIAFTYKKGLLPRLADAMRGIGGSVSTLKENTENAVAKLEEEITTVSAGCKSTEDICLSLSEKLSALSLTLDGIRGKQADGERMKIILSAQVDMLYEIFMASALPQYSKDAVFEKISEMRSMLKESEACDG